jgi:hypothetical protein
MVSIAINIAAFLFLGWVALMALGLIATIFDALFGRR